MIAKFVVLAAAVAWFGRPLLLQAQGGRPRTSQSVNQDVQPSPEIDERVAAEIAKAKQILDDLETQNVLASPYLVSAIYYHDNFLTDFPVARNTADPERRILGRISQMLSPELKARFVGLLHELWTRSNPPGPPRFATPVDYTALKGGRRSHKYAIDLFAPEGVAVRSASRGLVILADRDWNPADLFSTTSRRGGNAVIIFDPDNDNFYRYCHLSMVLVSPGEIVSSGQRIASVGHTGLNASQPGHGRHLHFEANEYLNGHVRTLDYRALRSMLRQWRAKP